MEDKRKNNGNKGHSTKAKGVDKRMNPYRDVINDEITPEDLKSVLRMLVTKATTNKDVKAAQLLMEYTLVKPKQEIDITTDGEGLGFYLKDVLGFGKSK
jgi:hypothetical protein